LTTLATPSKAPLPSSPQIGEGSRVEFDDAQDGPQKGTVLGIISTLTPPSAVILVDHALDGVVWNVPLAKLKPLPQVAA